MLGLLDVRLGRDVDALPNGAPCGLDAGLTWAIRAMLCHWTFNQHVYSPSSTGDDINYSSITESVQASLSHMHGKNNMGTPSRPIFLPGTFQNSGDILKGRMNHKTEGENTIS